MRLIDADALKEEVESHVTTVSVWATVDEARGSTAFKEECLIDIGYAPTIDAIPVEWIEQFRQDAIKRGDGLAKDMLDWLLGVWRREREAKA